MRSGATLLVLLVACTGSGRVDEVSTPAAGPDPREAAAASDVPRSPGATAPIVVPPPAPTVTHVDAASVPAVAAFRIVKGNAETVIAVAADGSVTGPRFSGARLGADGRLEVGGGERVLRIAANGDVLDGDEVFGRFIDEKTLSLAPNVTLMVADDGKITATATTVDGVTQQRHVKVLSDGLLRVETDEARARRLALFVLASEFQACPLGCAQASPKSKTASAVATGAAAVGLAALLGVGLYADAREHSHRLAPLRAKVKQERADAIDHACAEQGAAAKGYRYAGGSADDRAELARLESCVPAPGDHASTYFCCLL